jgi:hypothetical protein
VDEEADIDAEEADPNLLHEADLQARWDEIERAIEKSVESSFKKAIPGVIQVVVPESLDAVLPGTIQITLPSTLRDLTPFIVEKIGRDLPRGVYAGIKVGSA